MLLFRAEPARPLYDTTDTDALRRIYSTNVLVWRRRRVNAGRKRER